MVTVRQRQRQRQPRLGGRVPVVEPRHLGLKAPAPCDVGHYKRGPDTRLRQRDKPLGHNSQRQPDRRGQRRDGRPGPQALDQQRGEAP